MYPLKFICANKIKTKGLDYNSKLINQDNVDFLNSFPFDFELRKFKRTNLGDAVPSSCYNVFQMVSCFPSFNQTQKDIIEYLYQKDPNCLEYIDLNYSDTTLGLFGITTLCMAVVNENVWFVDFCLNHLPKKTLVRYFSSMSETINPSYCLSFSYNENCSIEAQQIQILILKSVCKTS